MSGKHQSPNYQVRPGKAIDRALFVDLLMRLQSGDMSFPIRDYRYVGFGALSFEEFKLLHKRLEINDMVSLEAERDIYIRQKFNKPVSCINLMHKLSSEYIAETNLDKNVIFWLDYTKPIDKITLDEIRDLLDKYSNGDILRLTFHADPSQLGGNPKKKRPSLQKQRINILRENLGDYFPDSVTAADMVRASYPSVLMRILKKMTTDLFLEQTKRMLPLAAYSYADGALMFTFTGIVLHTENVDSAKSKLRGWPHANLEWEPPHFIEGTDLTIKEILAIRSYLPSSLNSAKSHMAQMVGESDLPAAFDQSLTNYGKYYQYYPNFHQVIF